MRVSVCFYMCHSEATGIVAHSPALSLAAFFCFSYNESQKRMRSSSGIST